MANDRGLASEEIERTLRLERDEAERRIATFRVWFYVAIFASGPLMSFLRPAAERTWAPLVYFGAWLVYSLLLRRWVRKHGASDALIYAALLIDLVAIASPGWVFPLFDPSIRRDQVIFASHLVAPGQMLVLFVNVLRMHGRASVVGAIAGTAIALFTLLSSEPFVPPVVGVTFSILFTGLLGLSAARNARRSLEHFARLQLLRRFLPPAAVERVMTEQPDAALALGGREAVVTILAADLRGFTKMSERLPPVEVVRQLNAYHGRMLERIEAHGGALDKFIGDGILALFGFGGLAGQGADAADAGAAAAVACARDMLVALDGLNAERAKEGLPPLAMGVGVHSGPVVAGNIGAPGRRLEFTVIGDTVNTAARLEGLTKEAGVPLLVSHATVEKLGDAGAATGLEERPAMPVRGRDEALRVHAVREAAGAAATGPLQAPVG